MARKRMFSVQITESDAFLDMPLSSQALYFHLGMNADDEGFVNSPKRIQRMIGASEDDLKLLLAKHFIIAFESGVVVIKHWRINNTLQSDRIKDTVYKDERSLLTLKDNKAYTLKNQQSEDSGNKLETKCIQNVSINQSNITEHNINQSVYISKIITNNEMDRLTDCFADVPKLLELVDQRIKMRQQQTPIKNPFGYITAIAREEGWPTREEAERKSAAREARLREIEEQEQKDIDRLNRIARETFGKGNAT